MDIVAASNQLLGTLIMDIIYPIFSLVLLTFIVAGCVGVSRVLSVRRRQVHPKYYALMTGDTPPAYVQKFGRNFENLLEMPVLFYALGALAIVLKINDANLVSQAWLFVLLRFAHTAIHITYNNSLHRLIIFALSMLTLLSMWIHLFILVT